MFLEKEGIKAWEEEPDTRPTVDELTPRPSWANQ